MSAGDFILGGPFGSADELGRFIHEQLQRRMARCWPPLPERRPSTEAEARAMLDLAQRDFYLVELAAAAASNDSAALDLFLTLYMEVKP
jgi:hypothetical protein